jgi:large subunit ribosomal protein L6
MSKIGRRPIAIPAGTDVKVGEGAVQIAGKKARVTFPVPGEFLVKLEGGALAVSARDRNGLGSDPGASARYGTLRAKLNNAIVGCSTGFQKNLKLEGTGYKAELKGKVLTLSLGLSHQVVQEVPEGVKVTIPAESKQTALQLDATDKDVLGQFVARLQAHRPPEPYKGKGVRIDGVRIRQKAGKSGKGGK